MPLYPPASSGATITTQEEGVQLSATVTTLNFTGAGATASGAGAITTINIPGGSGDLALNLLAPAVDETVTAGYSCTVERLFTIASGKKLTIGSGARFRIH